MYRVTVCMLNSQYIHAGTAPYCLAAGVKRYGEGNVSLTVVDTTVNEAAQAVLQEIMCSAPDCIAFCCYIWNIRTVLSLITQIKSTAPHVKIVLGGPEAGFNAESLLREYFQIDYILSGEGELSFARLTSLLSKGKCDSELFKSVPGIALREGKEVLFRAPATLEEDPPTPLDGGYLEALDARIPYYESSRGCPFGCAFCLSGRDSSFRYFDIDRTKKDLVRLANSGPKTVKLLDRTFNAKPRYATEIFRFLIDNCGDAFPREICFHFEIEPSLLTRELLDTLSCAPVGLFRLECGIQSFDTATLRNINRHGDPQSEGERLRELALGGNLTLHLDLIAGLPEQPYESIARDVDFAISLHPTELQLGFLKLLHGTELRKQFKGTYSADPPYEIISAPWISAEELAELHFAEHSIDRLYNSGRFHRTLSYLFSELSFSPYAVFNAFGRFVHEETEGTVGLDEYITLFYRFASTLPGIDTAVLRDRLVLDRIATNPSGVLPKCLQIPDKRLRCLRSRESGVATSTVILYTEGSAVTYFYKKGTKNPVTGEYTVFTTVALPVD